MAKPNFTLPNKPAIKSGSILSYNYTDDFTFVPTPLTFNRDSAATRVNEKGLIEDVGYFGSELVQNGNFSEIGPELVTNGDFATDSDWSKYYAGDNNSITIANGVLSFNSNTNQNVFQTISGSNLDGFYKLTYTITSYTRGNPYLLLGGGSNIYLGSTLGTHTKYVQGGGSNANLVIYGGIFGQGGELSIDNVSVKEIGQNWALEGGWSVQNGLLVNDGTGINLSATQSGFFTVGNKYRVSLDIKSITQGSLEIYLGFPQSDVKTINSIGSYTYDIIASGNTTFYIKPLNNFIGSIDNVSVIEVLGDKPRIDYSDSLTEPSLLLEPQSTNLITYSEDFSQSNWAKYDINIESGYSAPDGSDNAYKVTYNGSNAHLAAYGGININKHKSIWARTVNGTGDVYLLNRTGNNLFTLTTKWQRFEIAHSGSDYFYGVDFRGAEVTLTEVLIWGAQLEQLSYPTSYIPTAGSTATRLGETANNAGDVNVFNSEEGVLYAELSTNFEGTSGVKAVSVQYDVNNYVAIYFRNDNNLSARVVGSGNITQLDTTYTINTFYKIAVSYNSTNVKFYVNGTQVDIDTTNTLPTSLNKVSFNRGSTSSLTEMEGKVKNVKVFNKALTDRELEILTIQ